MLVFLLLFLLESIMAHEAFRKNIWSSTPSQHRCLSLGRIEREPTNPDEVKRGPKDSNQNSMAEGML